MSTNQGSWPDSGQNLRHQYGISVAEAQTFLLTKRPHWRGAGETALFTGQSWCNQSQLYELRRWLLTNFRLQKSLLGFLTIVYITQGTSFIEVGIQYSFAWSLRLTTGRSHIQREVWQSVNARGEWGVPVPFAWEQTFHKVLPAVCLCLFTLQ